ncbi:MAG: serine/threonine-protein phosphatase [Thaumarchaeota archaeon]|nr:serine/threonine-protein phosphatase [Nitrososphaerota archaeon]
MIRCDSCTDSNSVGFAHDENQDSIVADVQKGIFAVADGVGGYKGAKEASSLAIDTLKTRVEDIVDENSFRECLEGIHGEIRDSARKLGYPGMGTTIAAVKILQHERKILTANVGDSPIFLVRDSEAIPLYFDDSQRSSDPGNLWALLQYVGFGPERPTVHTRTTSYKSGDVLLICSDGVSDNLIRSESDPASLADFVRASGSARRIVERAMEIGRKADDMSAVLVFF